MLLFGVAHAFSPAEVATLVPPHAATRLVPLERTDAEVVALVGPDAVDLVDAASHLVIASTRGAGDVAVREGGSGTELWLCGDDGLWRAEWPEAATVGEPALVLDAPCSAIASMRRGLVVLGETLGRWDDDGEGGLVLAEDFGVATMLAGNGTSAVAAVEGGSAVLWIVAASSGEADAGGNVGGVAVWERGAWSLPDEALVADVNGAGYPTAAFPGALAVADADDDGEDDLVVLHPDAVGIVRGGVEDLYSAQAVAIAGVSAVGCDEVWTLGDDGMVHVLAATDCGVDSDSDGDGWSLADGDCDDADPDAWPGAPEICADTDLDCDGVATWSAGVWLPESVAALEGSWVTFSVAAACGDLDWSLPDEPECRARDHGFQCRARDDFDGPLTVALLDADGAVLEERTATFTAVNVPPTVEAPFVGTFKVGELVAGEATVSDPGDDSFTFSLRDAPPGMAVDDDGNVTWTPSNEEIGSWMPTIVATDDDGGEGTSTFGVAVEERSIFDPCCGGSGAFLLFFGGVAARGRKRRAGTGDYVRP